MHPPNEIPTPAIAPLPHTDHHWRSKPGHTAFGRDIWAHATQPLRGITGQKDFILSPFVTVQVVCGSFACHDLNVKGLVYPNASNTHRGYCSSSPDRRKSSRNVSSQVPGLSAGWACNHSSKLRWTAFSNCGGSKRITISAPWSFGSTWP